MRIAVTVFLLLSLTSWAGDKKKTSLRIFFTEEVSCGDVMRLVRDFPVIVKCEHGAKLGVAYQLSYMGVSPIGEVLSKLERLPRVRRVNLLDAR